jgi:hypothetical protein
VNKRTGRKSESLPVGIEKKLWWRLLAPCVELFVKKKKVFSSLLAFARAPIFPFPLRVVGG